MILKPLPLTYQSKVLYILTAPTDCMQWYVRLSVCVCLSMYLSLCVRAHCTHNVVSSTGFVSWTQENCTVDFTELSKALGDTTCSSYVLSGVEMTSSVYH